MSLDPFDAMVLRAMLRLARRRVGANDGEIAVRVGRPPSAVRAALRRLDQRGLVECRGAPRPPRRRAARPAPRSAWYRGPRAGAGGLRGGSPKARSRPGLARTTF